MEKLTTTLGALLGVCALLATAKFVRRRARLLSLLVRAHGTLFAVMMGAVAVTAIIASVKPENASANMVGRAVPGAPQWQMSGSRVPRDREEQIAAGWRVAETREGCGVRRWIWNVR